MRRCSIVPPRLGAELALARASANRSWRPIRSAPRTGSPLRVEGIDADLVIIDCPPSLGLLTVNACSPPTGWLIVTEPGAWATDGVDQILRNIDRIADAVGAEPGVAGIVVNRLARTRDARYWDEQLVEAHADAVVRPAIRLRAAVAEASAQSLPLHACGRTGWSRRSRSSSRARRS